MHKVKCPVCLGRFYPRTSRSKYCSPACHKTGGRKIINRRRRLARLLAPAPVKAVASDKWSRWYRAHRKRDPLHFIIRQAKYRAKRAGLPFSICRADLLVDGVIPEFCPVLGFKLTYGGGSRKVHDDAASIDRIDNSLGYISGNVIVVSFRANVIKRDASVAELVRIAEFYRARQGELYKTLGPVKAGEIAALAGCKVGDTKPKAA